MRILKRNKYTWKEGFFMSLTQRELLFKLTACKGISNLGRLKVLDFSIHYNHTTDLTKEEIVQIAGITKYQTLFLDSWDFWTTNQEALAHYQQEHQFITVLDTAYPPLLRQTYNCPALLCYKGQIENLMAPCLAFVGTRKASSYGIRVVRQLVPSLVKKGFAIVSGLAKGIDSVAHQTAMAQQGQTIAVIGTGLDVYYPKETAHIQKKMETEQLVLTEYLNGTPPQRHHFPIRNRIIAGLSYATCIIEAKKRSGSLITAQAALDYGRDVFAVPGRITSDTSTGCHKLIQEGAKCISCPQDIIEEIQIC